MKDRMSNAAGRAVERLSRRRFLTWAGGGGAALVGGLSARPAFAQENCNSIRREFVVTGDHRLFAKAQCVDPGHCNFAPDAVLQNFCELRTGSECAAATHCPPPHHCRPLAVAGNNVIVDCHAIGDPGQRGCPPGQVLCQCTIRRRGGFPQGSVVCRCHCD